MLKLKEIHTKYKNKFLMKRSIGIFCLEKWWSSPHKRFSNQLNGLLSGMAQQILTLSKELAQMTWRPSNSFPIPSSVLNLLQDVSINHGLHGLELPYMTGIPLALCICTLKSLLELQMSSHVEVQRVATQAWTSQVKVIPSLFVPSSVNNVIQ